MSGAIIPDTFGVALAELLYGKTLYLAIGVGLAEWDALPAPPQPGRTQTQLYNEVARVVATNRYLTAIGGVSMVPTNQLECEGTYGLGVANGTLREMGLFVGGTSAINSGRMMAVVHFAAIAKPSGGGDYALTRRIRSVLLAR